MIPLKTPHPTIRPLVRTGLGGALFATFMFMFGAYLPATVQPLMWWLFNLGLSTAIVCLLAALAIGADLFKRERGGPPTV